MPKPGDLVFFDWIMDDTKDPQHVGVVLGVQDGRIYTIEGNSAGRVMIRSYPIDSQYILGYGVLPWAS
jgi:cell wall-associated NlpC family hydrolase